MLACLAIGLGRARGVISEAKEKELVRALGEVPRHISTILRGEARYEKLAHTLAKAQDVLYLGRGVSYPIALEGALKLKEISYIHAEGYAAGELKHGPDRSHRREGAGGGGGAGGRPVRQDGLQHAGGRRARRAIMLVSDAGAERAGCELEAHLPVPTAHPFTNPLLYAVPMQLLAYHTAVFMGTDVDQPRNLAKSVTVE